MCIPKVQTMTVSIICYAKPSMETGGNKQTVKFGTLALHVRRALAYGSAHRRAEPLAWQRAAGLCGMKPRAGRVHTRGSVSSYLEPTAKHLIIAAASTPAGQHALITAKTTAARAARRLASPVC